MPKLEFTVELDTITCGQCGIMFAVPVDFMQRRLNDHQSWWCPNGHQRHFTTETEAEKLKRELKHYQAYTDTLKAEVQHHRDQRKATERSLRATRGVLTRTKKRIAAGVCPCCHRTFQDLARHMAGKHPQYEESEP